MPSPRRPLVSRFLDFLERAGNVLPDPVILFAMGAAIVMVVSQIGYAAGWQVTPKRLAPVMVQQVDAGGAPVTGSDGKPVMVRAVDENGHPRLELVESGAPIGVRGLLSGDGLYYAISSLVDNFVRFPPLGVVLVGILGVGLAERTGFIGAGLKALMLVVPRAWLTPAVIFLGVNSSVATDAGYIVLPPLAAALYKSVGRSPMVGIAAAFAGIAGGFNANLLITSLDPLLASFTEPAARTIIDGYSVNPACNWWFMIASTFVLTLVGWAVTAWLVEPRFKGKSVEEGGPAPATEEDVAAQRLSRPEVRGLIAGVVAAAIGSAIFYSFVVVPGAPFDDRVRDAQGAIVTRADLEAIAAGGAATDPRLRLIVEGPLAGKDPAALLKITPTSPDAPVVGARRLPDAVRGPGLGDTFNRWVESIVPMLFFLFIVPGMVHGFVVGKMRSGRDASRLMIETMASMAPIIVLAFFAAQFIQYFSFSNLDKLLAHSGGQWLAALDVDRYTLIVFFILFTIVFDLFIASMSAKYAVFAPIFVPMLMLVGISPELTQAAYRIGDSCANIVTPLNSYVVIILVVMQKYAPKSGIGTLVSLMMPYSVAFLIAWIVMLLVWMSMGWSLGPGGPLTLPGAV